MLPTEENEEMNLQKFITGYLQCSGQHVPTNLVKHEVEDHRKENKKKHPYDR